MRIVLQRVKEASVEVAGRLEGAIERGICLLIGVEKGDTEEDVDFLARKAVELRIFPDAQGRMNLSLAEAGGPGLTTPRSRGGRRSSSAVSSKEYVNGVFAWKRGCFKPR